MPYTMTEDEFAETGSDSRPLPIPSAQPLPTLAWTAALMAHEIRAPIAAVRALVDLLNLHWHAHIPPGGLVLWNALQSEAERLHGLAEALLDLASAEYARPVLTLVHLDPLVRGLADKLAADHPHTLVTVEPLGYVEADERLIACLWDNLLGNAFKYSARNAQARIHVRARSTPGLREFSVSDNGIGIDEDLIERIFEPFNRSLRSRSIDGHGLGLATVRAIAHAHGGDAWAVGGTRAGAEVRFSLRNRLRADLIDPV
jgi:signal transduction histidine kinase